MRHIPPLEYPNTRRSDVKDALHGVEVPDPYRWLEDPDSEETQAWVGAQQRLANAYLATLPRRQAFKDRLTTLWNHPRRGLPMRRGTRWFSMHNNGLQNQAVLFTSETAREQGRVLLDPNTLSADGTVALQTFEVSPDGSHLAYALSAAGSDWMEWHIRDVATGKDLEEVLPHSKFSGASWLRDGSGFFYSRYDAPAAGRELEDINHFHKLCFHALHTPAGADRVVCERADQKTWMFGGTVTDDGRWLVITVSRGTDASNGLLVKDLTRPEAPATELTLSFDAEYSVFSNRGSTLFVKTNLDAPRGRIVTLDALSPSAPQPLIPQGEDTLVGVSRAHDVLVCSYLQHAHSVVRLHRLDGTLAHELPLPGLGSASGFDGHEDDPVTHFAFTSFTTPNTVYELNVDTHAVSLFWRPPLDVDPDLLETRQVFVESRDGTRVPMFLCHRRGLVLDGKNPTYLYGYGGFNISLTPSFSVSNLAWMEQGGVLAIANIRGGGEYGEAWHQDGILARKQNGFDDFTAAARWLSSSGYATAEHLGMGGGSNGGLLVGACLTQHPELFGAAIPMVGVLDMLRFHTFTIGWAWVDDYGCADKEADFHVLRAYSPLHNVKEGTHYPPTLVMTADHDDRVVPAHSFKFTAALQAAQAGSAPVLIRIETRAGHGAGKPTAKQIEEEADKWAFLWHVLNR